MRLHSQGNAYYYQYTYDWLGRAAWAARAVFLIAIAIITYLAAEYPAALWQAVGANSIAVVAGVAGLVNWQTRVNDADRFYDKWSRLNSEADRLWSKCENSELSVTDFAERFSILWERQQGIRSLENSSKNPRRVRKAERKAYQKYDQVYE